MERKVGFETMDYVGHPAGLKKLLVVRKRFDGNQVFADARVVGGYKGHDSYLIEKWLGSEESQRPPVPDKFLRFSWVEHPMHPWLQAEIADNHHRYRNRFFYAPLNAEETEKLSSLVTGRIRSDIEEYDARLKALKELEKEPSYLLHETEMKRFEEMDRTLAQITEHDRAQALKELSEFMAKIKKQA